MEDVYERKEVLHEDEVDGIRLFASNLNDAAKYLTELSDKYAEKGLVACLRPKWGDKYEYVDYVIYYFTPESDEEYNERIKKYEIFKAECEERRKKDLREERRLYNWVARNKDGDLFLYKVKPRRYIRNGWFDNQYWRPYKKIDNSRYEQVTWENSPIRLSSLKEGE